MGGSMNEKVAKRLNKYAGQGGFNRKQFKNAYKKLNHIERGKANKTMRYNLAMHKQQQDLKRIKKGRKK